MLHPNVSDMPMKPGLKFVAIVSSYGFNPERKFLYNMINKINLT